MTAFTGTGRLIRLALRRDRIKLPVWILATVGIIASGIPALKEFYATAEQQIQYASTTAPSMVSRLFAGPVDGANMGSIVMVEYFLFVAVVIAFMSTLTVIRHTRQNEEKGRSELIGSAVVGRHAALTAALVVAVGSSILASVLIALIVSSNGLPTDGAWAMALAFGGIGIVFAGVAAVTAQLVESGRAANALAAAGIGLAFLFRAIGDALGNVAENGLSVTSIWPSWLSPIGWGQQMHPFTDITWWPLALYGILFAVLVTAAFYLTASRDVGLGLFPARRGPASAPRGLLSSVGLAWRLQKGTLIGWGIGVGIMSAMMGVTAVEFESFFTENEDYAEILSALGGGAEAQYTDLFFAGMMGFLAFLIAAYSLHALMRLRSEETNIHLEPVLATGVSRYRWLLSHTGLVVAGSIALSAVAGILTAVTYILVSDAAWSEIWPIVGAAFVQLTAVLALIGMAVAFFGLLPRLMVMLTWTVFAACYLVLQFGMILKLPQWVLNLSPFTHTPSVPAESIAWTPILALLGAAILLSALGIAAFRRRDVTNS